MKKRRILVVYSVVLLLAGGAVQAQNLLSGFDSSTLAANDDGSTPQLNIGFGIDFYGHNYSQLYVNNNGNFTFDAAMATYNPFGMTGASSPIIAPFFADVDTRGAQSGLLAYGQGTYNGMSAFGATWNQVGYFENRDDLLNTFQVVLVDRSDINPGDFDICFRYDQVEWDTGIISPISAVAGYSTGDGSSYEIEGSAVSGAFFDDGANSLVETGVIWFQVRNGVVVPGPGSALIPFVDFALTPNGRRLAAGLDLARDAGASSPLLDELLSITDPAVLKEALESMVPENNMIPMQIALDGASRIHSLLGDSIGHAPVSPETSTNLWVSSYGQYVREDNQPGRHGFDYWNAGALIGSDLYADATGRAGFALAYDHTDFNGGGRCAGEGSIDTVQVGPYVQHRWGNLQVDSAILGGMHWNDVERRSSLGKNDADFYGINLSASGAVQYFAPLTETLALRPHMRGTYAYAREEGYRESGTDLTALEVDARSEDSFQSDVGLTLDFQTAVREQVLGVSVTAGYLHEFLSRNQQLTASFVDTPGAVFDVKSDASSPDSFYAGVMLQVPLNDRSLIDFGVSSMRSSSMTQFGGSVRFNWLW